MAVRAVLNAPGTMDIQGKIPVLAIKSDNFILERIIIRDGFG
jgi:hypothetical protein